MAKQVTTGAVCQCTFGVAPMSLMVTPEKMIDSTLVAANVMDNIPMKNVMPFGMCNAPTNPAVIAATAAALGVPTPAPCVPVIPGPWVPGGVTVMLKMFATLDNSSKLMCAYLGVISVNFQGQVPTDVP